MTIYTQAQEKEMYAQAQQRQYTDADIRGTERGAYYGEALKGNPIDSKQSPALFQYIATLEKSVHQLRDSLGQLGERLLPVSYPTPVQEGLGTGQLRTKVASPIADRLYELESLINDMNRRVQQQLESMDL